MKTIKILEKRMEMHKMRKNEHIKMIKLSAETYAKNCIHNIIYKEKMLWL